jgi:two-component system, OmpR family, response regulator ChvI
LIFDGARVVWRGSPVPLTPTEVRMVRLLAERAGRDVGYREIYDAARGQGFVAGSGTDGYRTNVRAAIRRIRQKFRDLDPEFDAIEAYAGYGYRWRA